MRRVGFVGVGLAVAFVVALFVGPFASSSPDGLARVALDQGFAEREQANPLEGASPVGGYEVDGVGDARVATGLAGAFGVALTFGLAYGGFRLLVRRRPATDAAR